MGNPGSIGDTSGLLKWFQQISGTTPVKNIFSPASSPEESPWIGPTEKKRVEEILAIMPPPPMINMAVFQNLSLHIKEFFGIDSTDSVSSEAKAFGAMESSILLGAAGAWAGAQLIGSALVESLMNAENKNPVTVALERYCENTNLTPIDARASLATLRNVPFSSALLQTADPDVLNKSFLLAEQQIVLSILDKWVEAEAVRAQEQRKEMVQLNMLYQERMQQVLKEYIVEAQEKQEAMKQPVLSILISALAMGPLLASTVQTLVPALAATTGILSLAAIPQMIRTELSAITAGFLVTVNAWATPVAMTLTTKAGGGSAQELALNSATAYALTLANFLTSTHFNTLITTRLNSAVKEGLLTPEQAKHALVSTKISLLLTAMAILYKAQVGGVTTQEIRGVINGTVQLEEGNFLGVLAKLVNEQLNQLSVKEKELFLNELLGPYDEDPPIDDLTDPISTFIGLWDPKFLRDMNTETSA